jgi:uroporphyrin-III C-methyltransferase
MDGHHSSSPAGATRFFSTSRAALPQTSERQSPPRVGTVHLVGAGPGDPELLTVRAARLLGSAAVVAYDELVPEAILALAPEAAELVPVGRRARGVRHHEGRIHPIVLERARAGLDVVRLKGGDPFVFGRGGEEAEELTAAGIPFTVVPGITAALGAAASAGLPLTYRGVSRSVTLATAHREGDAEEPHASELPSDGTLVLYMGLERLERALAALIASGRAPTTPAALVSKATTPSEVVVMGTLGDLAARVRALGLEPPALLLVGEAIARRARSCALGGSSAARSPAARAVAEVAPSGART